MTIKLVEALVWATTEMPTNWVSWVGLCQALVILGVLSLCKERARRRTYRELLDGVTPGTQLLVRSRRGREALVLVTKMPDWHRHAGSATPLRRVEIREIPHA